MSDTTPDDFDVRIEMGGYHGDKTPIIVGGANINGEMELNADAARALAEKLTQAAKAVDEFEGKAHGEHLLVSS